VTEIQYRYGNDLNLDQVIELYRASTLGERRPIDDRGTMSDMLAHANLVVTAWDGALLVGIARTLRILATSAISLTSRCGNPTGPKASARN